MSEPDKAMDGKYWMPVAITNGSFSSERIVGFIDARGNPFQVIEYVGHTKSGYVAVWIMEVDFDNNKCMIRVQNCRDFENIWVPIWW